MTFMDKVEIAKLVVTAVAAFGGLAVFLLGLIQFVNLTAIRRYEKFHEMSERFDENEVIQKVCVALHGSGEVNKQEKEVFVCFMEEIYFMVKSGIMKQYMACYTFGHYASMALAHPSFLTEGDKKNPFYVHFFDFCVMMEKHQPETDPDSKNLVF